MTLITRDYDNTKRIFERMHCHSDDAFYIGEGDHTFQDESDGWTYSMEPVTDGSARWVIRVIDEDDNFLGYL